MGNIRLNQNITQIQTEKAEFQQIFYYKDDGKNVISPKNKKQIDILKAISEMQKIDWTHKNNFIGFKNYNNNDNVQFIRIKKDEWYCDVPIKINGKWDKYYWKSFQDSKTVFNVVRLFFEEQKWFESIEWKMNAVKHSK